MNSYNRNYRVWLSSESLSPSEKEELVSIEANEDEIKHRFSTFLAFGTGGLRGIMKTGMNAMNTHTVAHATQALSELVLLENAAERGVVIAHDSRNNSRIFAEVSASVLAANGIKTYIFDDLRPTPELSFAVRELHCIAGINITASHNPKEYNGYKAYWEDGAQLSPEQASVVSAKMSELDVFLDVKRVPFSEGVQNGSWRSIQSINGRLYYKGVSNVLAYDGGLPVSISATSTMTAVRSKVMMRFRFRLSMHGLLSAVFWNGQMM